jgi:hypothetical protein
MNFPSSISNAVAQIEKYILEHIMQPPHYKYRLNSLAYDCMKQWDVADIGNIPILKIFYKDEDPKINKGEAGISFGDTGLTFVYNIQEFMTFLHLDKQG